MKRSEKLDRKRSEKIRSDRKKLARMVCLKNR